MPGLTEVSAFLWLFCVLLGSTPCGSGKNDRGTYSYQYVHRLYNKKHYYDFTTSFEDNPEPDNNLLCLLVGICTTYFSNAYRPDSQEHRTSDNEVITTVYEWTQLEYDYETEEDRNRDIQSGVFHVGHPAPIDTDIFYSGGINKIFVTSPKFQPGVPASLGVVTSKTYNGNPVIRPYPSWRWHRNPHQCNKDRIVSVYRIAIDECKRLWVLDTARFGDERICPPQILAFDLHTDKLLHRFEIPKHLYEERSILVTPIVDVVDPEGHCENTFVYVADCQAYSIIVHDVKKNTAWKATDKTMYPYPNFGTFDIQGDHFDLMDGVLGMALAPYRYGEDRKLFYHAMSSDKENFVYTSHLRNQSLFEHDPSGHPEMFHTYGGTRQSQSCAIAIDRNGVAFFGLMHQTTINCWNTADEYVTNNFDVISDDPLTSQFASGMKVVNNRKGTQELWYLTSRFQRLAVGKLLPTETNFRIQAGKIDRIVEKKSCKARNLVGGSGGYYHHGHNNGGYQRPVYVRSAPGSASGSENSMSGDKGVLIFN